MDELNRKERAMQLFREGYNCAQSIVLAFQDLLPIAQVPLSKLASSFGGGMGKLREVCGALTGSFMVIGLLFGYSEPESGEKKAAHYANIQAFAHLFEQEFGSILCRNLLSLSEQHSTPTPSERTEAYYHERPCETIVGKTAELLSEYLSKLEIS